MRRFGFFVLILALLLLAACGAPATPAPTSAPTRPPEPTHTPTSAPTQTPTSTLTNTPTPTQTPLPTSTPTATPRPSSKPVPVIGSTVIDEWLPPPQCWYSIAPDWQHVMAVCPQEKDEEISDIYLAMWGSQAETWQKITEMPSTVGVDWAPDSFHFTLGAYGHPLYLYALSTLDTPIQLISFGLANVSWSPSSEYLATISSPLKFHVFDLDGHEALGKVADKVTFQNLLPLQRSLQWLPNGHQIFLFIYDEVSWRRSLSLVDLTDGETEFLVKDLPAGYPLLFSPGLSPDSSCIGFGRGEYLNLETQYLRLDACCDSCSWSQDSRAVYTYRRTDDGRVEVTFFCSDARVKLVILPDDTYFRDYHALDSDGLFDVNFDYHEFLRENFYYHYSESDRGYGVYRYNTDSDELVKVLPDFSEWDYRYIIERRSNRWLLRLQDEDNHREVVNLKFIILETDDDNLKED